MANSRKNPQPELLELVEACLGRHALPDCPKRLCVGLSGGLDSVVLLHLAAQLRQRMACELSAVHVHHGLSPNADQWANFVCHLAESLTIACTVERVEVGLRAELGLEAAARRVRYAVFEQQDCDFLLLAQHRDDQAETVLLNLLRGSGVRGLAAMPECRTLKTGIRLLRPLLDVPRRDLLAYAQAHDLQWIEDESNADQSFDRNWLRHSVFPLLRQQYRGVDAALVRSASHQAEASALLTELAQQDVLQCLSGAGFDLPAASALSELRQRNALRYWLNQAGVVPDARAFDELWRVMQLARADAEPVWRWREHEVRRYRERIYVLSGSLVAGPLVAVQWQSGKSVAVPAWGGTLCWQKSTTGIAEHFLRSGSLELRPRAGGERLRLRAGGSSRSLKHLCQAAGIPPWWRDLTPQLWIDGQLAAVPGLGTAAEFSEPGGWQPEWSPDQA